MQDTTLFRGLSAFPLTPVTDSGVDEGAFVRLIERLSATSVDSITVLGSTGSYPYLTREERAYVARLAVDHADRTPVFVGVGSLRTSHVLEHVADAEDAGADGVLLAPMTYQPLTDADVLHLFETVCARTDLPVIVYDNPGTTHFTFSLDLIADIAQIPGISSIKIPPVPTNPSEAKQRIDAVRNVIPDRVTIGVSGDASAASGLNAGCDAWYSVIGGTLPELALRLYQAAPEDRMTESERLAPLWNLFAEYGGSLRVVAAIAEHLGLVTRPSLPLPIRGLSDAQRARVAEVVTELGLTR